MLLFKVTSLYLIHKEIRKMMKLEDVRVGHGAVRGFNGDAYPFYIVGIERGKYTYNKDKITGLWLVPADAKCKNYYANVWEVEDYDPNKHTMEKAFYVKATRKNPAMFSENGVYGVWCYRLCEKPYRSENPSF